MENNINLEIVMDMLRQRDLDVITSRSKVVELLNQNAALLKQVDELTKSSK
jgi:hypothetical protein